MEELVKGTVYLHNKVVSEHACREYMKYIDEQERTTTERQSGTRYRGRISDENLRSKLWDILHKSAPKLAGKSPVSCTPLTTLLKYAVNGQGTGKHFDHREAANEQFAVLMYLNDDYGGGETEFYDRKGRNVLASVKAKAGDVVYFHMDMRHKGNPTRGEKYAIYTRLLYPV
jgi:hypothetical protein